MGCVDPFVMFNILGIPQDYAEVKTKVVRTSFASNPVHACHSNNRWLLVDACVRDDGGDGGADGGA